MKINESFAAVKGYEYEYIAYKRSTIGEKRYYLIREYNKNNNKNDVIRNTMVYDKTMDIKYIDARPSVSELTSYDDRNSHYYYVIIEMGNKKPRNLTNKALTNMSILEKLNLCYSIAKTVSILHRLDDAIYFRVLNHEEIKLIDTTVGVEAKIICNDFAKIEGQNTVVEKLRNFEEINTRDSVSKYKANEFNVVENDNEPSYWEKIDVFAIGVLMRDIIAEKIGDSSIPTIDEIKKHDLSNTMIDIMIKMCSGNPKERPSAEEVYKLIENEMKNKE